MVGVVAFARPSTRPLELFGTDLIGATPENARKLLLTVVLLAGLVAVNWLLRLALALVWRGRHSVRGVFWTRQGVSLVLTVLGLVAVASVWFDNPTRLATAIGLVSAGVAFALQKPITALAGYLVILRGRTFNLGDRITMGGVRGDVVQLGFLQTTILEMGQPPDVAAADPAMWVHSRQYTGRLVTVSNAKVFDEPVYNYTRDFPFIWEEMMLPITYAADRAAAERILLDAAAEHTATDQEVGAAAVTDLSRRFLAAAAGNVEPRVYWRLTDNWLELTVRFLAPTHGVRDLKDAMSRDILAALDAAKIGIASATYDVVGLPPIRVTLDRPAARGAGGARAE